MHNENFPVIQGFSQEPESDGRNLAALFGNDEDSGHQNIGELDFRYDPSSLRESELITPKPRIRSYSSPKIISGFSLGGPIRFDFTEFGIRTVSIFVVNGEILRFDDALDGSELCSVSIASSRLSMAENSVALWVGDDMHSKFVNDSQICTKLCAIMSSHHVVESLVFSTGGVGEDEVAENAHVLFSQLSFIFTNNQLQEMPDQTTNSKHLKLKAKRLEDPFLKHFKGKRLGARFVVAINGIASCYELKRIKTRTSNDSSGQQTPPLPIEEPLPTASAMLQTRMSKMGGIQLIPTEIVKPKPQQNETNSEVEEEEIPPRSSLIPVEVEKPVPVERKATSLRDDLEKRIAELEAKVDQFIATPVQSVSNNRYEFAMDVWAKICASSTIPSEAKPEIKKLLISTAIQ